MAKNKKPGGSLQNQLKNMGLATNKQIRKAEKGIHRKEMRVKQGQAVDENKKAAEQALALKRIRDREHNKKLNQKAHARALQSQIRQLIEMNCQRQEGEAGFNFTEGKKIRKIYISESNKQQLSSGLLAIVKLAESYELVPAQVARKIIARIPDSKDQVVLFLFDNLSHENEDDDPYKDFPIPDDLDW